MSRPLRNNTLDGIPYRRRDVVEAELADLPEGAMGVTANDVVPLTRARADLSALAEQANAGAEKIITKHGKSFVALISAARLEYYHQLERERMHLLLLDDAKRGLADIDSGRTVVADAAIEHLQQRRGSFQTVAAAKDA